MYRHALRRKKDIVLNRLEVYNTRTFIYSFMARIGLVLFSLSLAVYGYINDSGNAAALSGLSFSLLGVILPFLHGRRRKKIHKLFSKEEIDEMNSEVIVVEEKN